MSERKLIMFIRNRNGSKFPIHVPLPLDKQSWFTIERQIEDLGRGLVVSDEDIQRFKDGLAYLPATPSELHNADVGYAEGLPWDVACERARAIELEIGSELRLIADLDSTARQLAKEGVTGQEIGRHIHRMTPDAQRWAVANHGEFLALVEYHAQGGAA